MANVQHIRFRFLSWKVLELCAAVCCALGRLSCLSGSGVRYVDAQHEDYAPHHALDCSWPGLHWTVQIHLLTTQDTADWSLWKEFFLVQRTIFAMITAKKGPFISNPWFLNSCPLNLIITRCLRWKRGRGQCTYTCKNEWSRWEMQENVCTGNSGAQEMVYICGDIVALAYTCSGIQIKESQKGPEMGAF